MEPVIKAENLTHTYSVGTPFQRNAIKGVSLSVHSGEFIGLIGHTGSGKSTLIRHLNGLLKPTEGHVYLRGEDIWRTASAVHESRFHVGLVFQYPEHQLFEETIYRDIAFGPTNMGLTAEEIDRRVRESAQFVGLKEEDLERSPFSLSGGQKRRAAIAGVLAMEPEVLILDEPTAGLDPAGCESILSRICAYHKAKGSAVILVSHNMDEIARTAARVVVLDHGQIAMDGTPGEVFSRDRELSDLGLDVPCAARVASALRRRGVDVGIDVYTIEKLRDAVLRLRGAGA